MNEGDLVRIVKENLNHGGKTALIVDKEVESWYDPTVGRYRHEIVFSVLLDGRVRHRVTGRWLEVINDLS